MAGTPSDVLSMTRAAIYVSIKEVEKLARQLDIHTSIPALHALEAAVMRLFACVNCTRVMEERVIFKALDQAHDKVCAQKNMYEEHKVNGAYMHVIEQLLPGAVVPPEKEGGAAGVDAYIARDIAARLRKWCVDEENQLIRKDSMHAMVSHLKPTSGEMAALVDKALSSNRSGALGCTGRCPGSWWLLTHLLRSAALAFERSQLEFVVGQLAEHGRSADLADFARGLQRCSTPRRWQKYLKAIEGAVDEKTFIILKSKGCAQAGELPEGWLARQRVKAGVVVAAVGAAVLLT
mmetsp:Transcript_56051/g.177620  ORF Transcript_56051/g.177620 Transcript_56051/m.177620 type:complete len:292 (+) Transcript_56051:85-960(+)